MCRYYENFFSTKKMIVQGIVLSIPCGTLIILRLQVINHHLRQPPHEQGTTGNIVPIKQCVVIMRTIYLAQKKTVVQGNKV